VLTPARRPPAAGAQGCRAAGRARQDGGEGPQRPRRFGPNRHRLDAVVEALLHAETLDAADAYRAAGVPVPAQPELPAESISG
jgi:hypothetical protein